MSIASISEPTILFIFREKTSSSEFHVPKTKLNLSSVTHAPMNVLLAEPINATDIKLVGFFYLC